MLVCYFLLSFQAIPKGLVVFIGGKFEDKKLSTLNHCSHLRIAVWLDPSTTRTKTVRKKYRSCHIIFQTTAEQLDLWKMRGENWLVFLLVLFIFEIFCLHIMVGFIMTVFLGCICFANYHKFLDVLLHCTTTF